MKKNSKRYRGILKTSIRDKIVAVKEALDLVKKNSNTKFDESIDVSLKINLKHLNSKDTKDYKDGVWTLPPSLRLKDVDREKYLAIGESDRMTLLFKKPIQ